MTAVPKPDKGFEAGLVDADADGSRYKSSMGDLDGISLKTSDHMVNSFTYKEFIITEEPVDDVYPNVTGMQGGSELVPHWIMTLLVNRRKNKSIVFLSKETY